MTWAAAAPYIASFAGAALSNMLGGKPDTSAGDAAARASGIQAQISLEQWENYKKNFMPLQEKLISEAEATGSQEAIAEAEGRAAADVTGAFDRSNKAAANRMRAYGINPASPAFGSETTTSGLAEGAAMAGARTGARRNQLDLSYTRKRDIVGLGMGIPPAASAAASGSAGSAGIYQNALNAQYGQNQQNQQNVGYALQPLIGAAANYFGQQSNVSQTQYPQQQYPTQYAADGGMIGLEEKRGMHKKMIHMAVKSAMTPHMRRYADGGGVGTQGLEPARTNSVLNGPGTETSDSIPAQIDGQRPAALSTGEFVMTAEVPQMTGEEILQAINRAGLEKRQGGNEYACGGKIKHGLR